MRTIEGRARRLGHDINTDYIIASTRKRETLDASLLKKYLLETLDPAFAASVKSGDLLVAGRNFGCGSAMEVAVTVLLASGINAVLAESFSRTFFRNAINNGLLPVQCDTAGIQEGDQLVITLREGVATVQNVLADQTIPGAPISSIALEILESGGLVHHIRHNNGFR